MNFHLFKVLTQRCVAGLVIMIISACTPQQMLLSALIPDGTTSMLLSHLQSVESGNRQRIVELEQQGDWPGLAKFADDNIAKDPFSAEWRLIGGYAQSQQGHHARAAEYFGEMVRLSPDDVTGYHFLAEAQRANGQSQRAVTTLERALLVVRESALTHRLLGDSYSDLARYRPAAESYRRALAIDPMLAEAWYGLGRAAQRMGRTAEVQEALRALEQMRSPQAVSLRKLLESS